jgi:FHA domain-containing protein
MAPVNPSASSSPTSPEVDNEATAELPVLDVAAYEATLNEPLSHTDTWVIPGAGATPQIVEATPLPVLGSDSIPTLKVAVDLEHTAEIPHDFSGTHEMPSLPPFRKSDKVSRVAKAAAKTAARDVIKDLPQSAAKSVVVVTPPAAAAPPAPRTSTAGQLAIPPSPPMIEELRNALAAAERRIEELNERARIADAERNAAVARANAEAAQLRVELGTHLEKISTASERLGVQRTDEPELQDELFRRYDRINALESEVAHQSKTILDTAALLSASQKRADTLDVESMNLRAGIARRDSQIAILEAELQARQDREAHLSARLTELLASIDVNVPDLRDELRARDEQVRRLDADLKAARALLDDKNEDLQVAEESIRNLEIEVRDKSGKLSEANVAVEEWRAVIAESQRSILQRDSRIQELEADMQKRLAAVADSAANSSAQTGEEIALEGPARVLIRTDGNTDFVHVLGRRTRIGRGNDNELVLDTKHISRYHAVLLAGPVHTSIEDLNSTNGVFVNGKRISRQVLKDGDRVTVGKTHFRYTVRD